MDARLLFASELKGQLGVGVGAEENELCGVLVAIAEELIGPGDLVFGVLQVERRLRVRLLFHRCRSARSIIR